MNKFKSTGLAVIITAFAAGAYLYPSMPGNMASHWDANGQVNGYMSKFWALFLLPIVTLAAYSLFLLLPKIDPLKANYKKFRKYYDGFLAAFVLFMAYIYALTVLWNKGFDFDMTAAIIPAMATLFYFVGVLLEKAKQNWFIGIRTPWTLSSEAVWDKTNKLGAKIFKIFGAASLLGVFLEGTYFFLLIIALVIASLYLIVYSYFAFRKEKP